MTAARKPRRTGPELAFTRILEGKERPSPRLVKTSETTSAPAVRDLDAPDETILTLCGRRIERHAGRFTRAAIDPATGEVTQVEQRTRENTYTLWEPAAAGTRYARARELAGKPWGAAHTLCWPGPGDPSYREAVDWELQQWRRATSVIRGACPELAREVEGVGGQVLEVRGEVLLGGTLRLRYQAATRRREAAHG